MKTKNDFYKNMLISKALGKTEFRFEFSVKNYVFQHRTKFWHFLKKCKYLYFLQKIIISKLITSTTHGNKGFQPLGVSKIDFSWSKAAWSIFQSLLLLLLLENRWETIETSEAENLNFSNIAGNHLKRCALMR